MDWFPSICDESKAPGAFLPEQRDLPGRMPHCVAFCLCGSPGGCYGAGMTRLVVVGLLLAGCSVQPMAKVAPGDGGASTAQGPGEESGPVATSMKAQLVVAGLDVDHLPDLDKVPDDKIVEVMKTFTASLGATCDDCHTADRMEDTPRKLVAGKMWSEFVLKMKRKDGSALFCDSCHQGKLAFLDRSDEKTLAGWMDTNFVDGLSRTDGTAQTCTSCHGKPFDPSFLDGWEGAVSADGGTTSDADAGVVATTDLAAPDLATPATDLAAPVVCVPSVNEVQVAGTGGASDEFVELYNPCAQAVSLSGYTLVYRSAAGANETLLAKLDGQTLAPGAHLVVGNTSFTGTAALSYASSLANAGGGVGLRGSDGALVDSVAWGTAQNVFVQGHAAAAPPAGKSVARVPAGSHAHADQSLDLVVGAATPGA